MRRSIIKSRLQFERLEDRSLLAMAAFAFNLYHDEGGLPGLPLAEDTVEVGQSFFAQITAREYHPGFSGLGAVSVDVAWDADVLRIVEPFDPRDAVTSNLPLFVGGRLAQEDSDIRPFVVNGQIRQNVGTIDGLGGSAFEASGVGRPIGSDGDDRYVKPQFLGYSTTDDHFAWLHFRAEQAGEALLMMRQGGLRIVTAPATTLSSKQLHFEFQTVTVVPSSTPAKLSPLEADAPPTDELVKPVSEAASELTVRAEPPIVAVPAIVAATDPLPGFEESSGSSVQEPSLGTTAATSVPASGVVVERPLLEDPVAAFDGSSSVLLSRWHNARDPLDVDGTGRVAPVDVVILVNFLNVRPGRWELPAVQSTPPRYLDVNGDGHCTAHDAVLVINHIDRQAAAGGEGEFSLPSAAVVAAERPDVAFAPAVTAEEQPMTVLPVADQRGRDSTGVAPAHPARCERHETASLDDSLPAVDRPDHVAASLRDANNGLGETELRGAESGLGETGLRGAAADQLFRTRRIGGEIWTELEEILPDLAAGWLPTL